MEEVHFRKISFRHSGSTVWSLLRTKIEAKIAPRWAQDGPRMDSVGQVVARLGRGWAEIVQKLQGRGQDGHKRSRDGAKMVQDEAQGEPR